MLDLLLERKNLGYKKKKTSVPGHCSHKPSRCHVWMYRVLSVQLPVLCLFHVTYEAFTLYLLPGVLCESFMWELTQTMLMIVVVYPDT